MVETPDRQGELMTLSFSPCLTRSLPGLPPGVGLGNLLLNKVNYGIPHFPPYSLLHYE